MRRRQRLRKARGLRVAIAAVIAVKTLSQLLTTNVPFGASLEGEIQTSSLIFPSNRQIISRFRVLGLLGTGNIHISPASPGTVFRVHFSILYLQLSWLFFFSRGMRQLCSAGLEEQVTLNITSYRFSVPRTTIHQPTVAKMRNIEEGKVTCCVTIVYLGASHWVTSLRLHTLGINPWQVV